MDAIIGAEITEPNNIPGLLGTKCVCLITNRVVLRNPCFVEAGIYLNLFFWCIGTNVWETYM